MKIQDCLGVKSRCDSYLLDFVLIRLLGSCNDDDRLIDVTTKKYLSFPAAYCEYSSAICNL